MCGILGVAGGNSRVDEDLFGRALATLAARGPDDAGTWSGGPVILGHRRLSILDLSPQGHQPMTDLGGRFTMVYNGEVYNFPDLRRELISLGNTFRSRSDTEVVLAAFSQWGTDAFRRLNGIFACAIHDNRDDSLILARDRMGVKPLYWHQAPDGRLIFSSEIKAILALLHEPRRVDPQSLHEFLYFGVAHGRRTMYQGIQRLEAGHWMRWQNGNHTDQAFWRIEDVSLCRDDPNAARERIVELLRAAVGRQLIADVPVGCFLSGGVDSTAIATFATEHGARPDAYTASFEHQLGTDEVALARATAKRLGLRHETLPIHSGDLHNLISELVAIHDEPFSDAANIPLLLLCRALGGRTKVILQGDGGDELFAGYRRYNLLSRLPSWKRRAMLRPLTRAVSRCSPWMARCDRLLAALGTDDAGAMMGQLLTVERLADPPTRILSLAWRERVQATDPFERHREMAGRFTDTDPVQRMLKTDVAIILPDIFLEKVDRATMASGVESRVPFLDNALVEYALSLPSVTKMPGGRPKGLLRQALAPYLDPTLLRQPKSGFGVPFSQWLRAGPLSAFAEESIRDPAMIRRGIFDDAFIASAFASHRSGRRDHGFLLWKAMNLAIWFDRYDVN